MSAPAFPPGTFSPDPRPARWSTRVLAATRAELSIQLRNGEQLLLALVIPLAVLVGLTVTRVVELPVPAGGSRVDVVAPGALTLAVVSSAFTAQAISTAFDRRYGVLLRLAAAGMSRRLVFAAKTCSVLAVVAGQLVVLTVAALLLGWRPAAAGWPWAVLLVLLAVAALVSLALLLGGSLRAEAVLAGANVLWLVFVGLGGVIAPLTAAPHWLAVVGGLTPVGALSDGLHAALGAGEVPGLRVWLVLLVWWLVAGAAAERWFRWQ